MYILRTYSDLPDSTSTLRLSASHPTIRFPSLLLDIACTSTYTYTTITFSHPDAFRRRMTVPTARVRTRTLSPRFHHSSIFSSKLSSGLNHYHPPFIRLYRHQSHVPPLPLHPVSSTFRPHFPPSDIHCACTGLCRHPTFLASHPSIILPLFHSLTPTVPILVSLASGPRPRPCTSISHQHLTAQFLIPHPRIRSSPASTPSFLPGLTSATPLLQPPIPISHHRFSPSPERGALLRS
ncbi:hypothetical protein C8Q76DRAFT_713172 [Earliella scabrosa]|nr:hypothetical protein C8Q76DRAFT_713172 [Earliella scabrosa]